MRLRSQSSPVQQLMPELPDITIYIEALQRRVVGQTLKRIRVRSPFLVRTFDPPLDSVEGKTVREVRRLGKRIALGFDDGIWMVLHLMIAGRLHWKPPNAKLPGKYALAAFDFADGTLLFTEAGSKHRASLHVVRGEEGLRAHDPGGLDVFACTLEEFAAAIRRENHTLKRTLTDPHVFDGIGNAYSDEILHRARLSPFVQTKKIADDEVGRLFDATREGLREWIDRLRAQAGEDFPEKVTAFRPDMAVHGKFGKPCPICGAKVQRIRYADNETNYCPGCQTEGRILADRSLSRLLRDDWPKHIDDLE
jgi:formamidopyrimidine-DNA glycosylase